MKKCDPFQYFKIKHQMFENVVIEFRGKEFRIYKQPTREISGLKSTYNGSHFLINDTTKRSSKNNVVNYILKNA